MLTRTPDQNSKNRLLQTYLSMHKPILLRGALAALVGIVCCITWPLLVEALARHLRMTSDDPTASRDFSGLDISLCASVLCLALFVSSSLIYYRDFNTYEPISSLMPPKATISHTWQQALAG